MLTWSYSTVDIDTNNTHNSFIMDQNKVLPKKYVSFAKADLITEKKIFVTEKNTIHNLTLINTENILNLQTKSKQKTLWNNLLYKKHKIISILNSHQRKNIIGDMHSTNLTRRKHFRVELHSISKHHFCIHPFRTSRLLPRQPPEPERMQR